MIDKDFKIINGDSLVVLDTLEPESVDSIVTDPPYGLTTITKRFGKEGSAPCKEGKDGSFARLTKGFMGKVWDGSGIEYNVELWKKAYNVLKPGGYLLAFGGTRTYHRIACAIEDAGFEIRDCIMWLYGCLSEDTEILTSNGWKNSETISKGDLIYSLNLQKNTIIKNKCINVFKYDYDGEMVSLKNQNTDQLLTPNHHCIVRDEFKTKEKKTCGQWAYDYWHYKDAYQIRSESNVLPLAAHYDGPIEIGNLFAELLGWVISEGHYLKNTNAIMITQSSINMKYVKRIRYVLRKLKIKYSEYVQEKHGSGRTSTEYFFYLGKEASDVVDKIKELAPDKKLNYGLLELSASNKEFLLRGLCMGDGQKDDSVAYGFISFYQKDMEQLEVFQALLHLSGKQGWINPRKRSCSISINPTTQIQAKHNKNRLVPYTGSYVWCIETEAGNFMARRNGKIFITGNSGFPKSHNVGLDIDKKLGCPDRGHRIATANRFHPDGTLEPNGEDLPAYEGKTELGKQWQGWGTALKPAYEPIIVARKPLKGSVADNVMKYGVGGINIDDCRIGDEEHSVNVNDFSNQHGNKLGNREPIAKMGEKTVVGRFPANVIHDGSEEVVSSFPNTQGSQGKPFKATDYEEKQTATNFTRGDFVPYNDDGSASRFFYCAKASSKDRDEGLYDFDEKKTGELQGGRKEGSAGSIMLNEDGSTRVNPYAGTGAVKKNFHPTVKPTELMQYLVRLVSPKGATILDIFNGSGSTGKAVAFENRERNMGYKYIGIELDPDYCKISEARIEYALHKYKYDLMEEIQENKKKGQLSLFDDFE